ncbi:hypothetical protein HDU88_003210 [Geranomyces variabilis]|nr:hypothetical protein HDU88_003210 [Geranomyces variabilis]
MATFVLWLSAKFFEEVDPQTAQLNLLDAVLEFKRRRERKGPMPPGHSKSASAASRQGKLLFACFSRTGSWPSGRDETTSQVKLAESTPQDDVAPVPVSHERTTWVDKVIPWFSPLRTTGLIQWKWCEIGYGALMLNAEANNDHAPRSTKLGDGLGVTAAYGYEYIIMESIGYETKEYIQHSRGDSFKLIGKSILLLRHIRQCIATQRGRR